MLQLIIRSLVHLILWTTYIILFIKWDVYVFATGNTYPDIFNVNLWRKKNVTLNQQYIDDVVFTPSVARCYHLMYEDKNIAAVSALPRVDGYQCFVSRSLDFCNQDPTYGVEKNLTTTFYRPCCHLSYPSEFDYRFYIPFVQNHLEFQLYGGSLAFIGFFTAQKQLGSDNWFEIYFINRVQTQVYMQEYYGDRDSGTRKTTYITEIDLLPSDSFSALWIEYSGETVLVGRGGSREPFGKTTLREPITEITYLALTQYAAPGNFSLTDICWKPGPAQPAYIITP